MLEKLRSDLIEEFHAINQYEEHGVKSLAIVDKSLFQELADLEKVHVAELLVVISEYDYYQKKEIEKQFNLENKRSGPNGVEVRLPTRLLENALRMLREDIITELKAINQYETHIRLIENPTVSEKLQEIANAEKYHVARLLKRLTELDPVQYKVLKEKI